MKRGLHRRLTVDVNFGPFLKLHVIDNCRFSSYHPIQSSSYTELFPAFREILFVEYAWLKVYRALTVSIDKCITRILYPGNGFVSDVFAFCWWMFVIPFDH